MDERIRTPLAVGAILALFAIAAVGYAAAQAANDTATNGSATHVGGSAPAHGAAGHVCPKEAAAASATTTATSAAGA